MTKRRDFCLNITLIINRAISDLIILLEPKLGYLVSLDNKKVGRLKLTNCIDYLSCCKRRTFVVTKASVCLFDSLYGVGSAVT